jgi:hypothetical protein
LERNKGRSTAVGFMDKVKAAAQDVASEAKKATAQGKTRIDQLQTKKKMDDAARALGYLVHAERTKGTPAGPEADRLAGEITQLEAQLAAEQAAEGQGGAPTAAGYVAPQPQPGQTAPGPEAGQSGAAGSTQPVPPAASTDPMPPPSAPTDARPGDPSS